MSIIKKGTCDSKENTISSEVYICEKCGHTSMKKVSKCPECNGIMKKVSNDNT